MKCFRCNNECDDKLLVDKLELVDKWYQLEEEINICPNCYKADTKNYKEFKLITYDTDFDNDVLGIGKDNLIYTYIWAEELANWIKKQPDLSNVNIYEFIKEILEENYENRVKM